MATEADVRRIALSLPGVVEAADDFAFSVEVKGKAKGFAWCWKERVVPKKPRIPNHCVLALRVANNLDKDLMMRAEPDKYVVDPHYNGYPAVLVRLDRVRVPELRDLLMESHRCMVKPSRELTRLGGSEPDIRPVPRPAEHGSAQEGGAARGLERSRCDEP